MMLTQPPCFGCTGRYIGCHSGCQTWKDWKAEDDKTKSEIRVQKDKEKRLDDFLIKASRRIVLDADRRAKAKKARS